jgi:hypothetical protein
MLWHAGAKALFKSELDAARVNSCPGTKQATEITPTPGFIAGAGEDTRTTAGLETGATGATL